MNLTPYPLLIMYKVSVKKTILQVVHPDRRKPKFLAILFVLLSPLQLFFDKYYVMLSQAKKSAEIVPQVAVLEASICEMLNIQLGSITITNSVENSGFVSVSTPAGRSDEFYQSILRFLNQNTIYNNIQIDVQHIFGT
jgi:hypothetical protein